MVSQHGNENREYPNYCSHYKIANRIITAYNPSFIYIII
jgi:hypothetical protein